MDKIEKLMVRRAVIGVVLAWLLVALGGLAVIGMCGCGGLGVPLATCHYALTTPVTEGDAACSIEHSDAITFALDGAHPITLTVRILDATGYARLESDGASRRASGVTGEVYGLSSLTFDGCTDWGGHAAWSIAPDGWTLMLVATCARPSGALYLNGEIMRQAYSR